MTSYNVAGVLAGIVVGGFVWALINAWVGIPAIIITTILWYLFVPNE
jgi:hypothetical protein